MASNAENVFIWWRHHELVFVVNIELISVPLGALMTGLLESMPADLRESRTMDMELRTVCVWLLNTVLQNDFAEYWTANMPSRDQMQTKFSCCGISTVTDTAFCVSNYRFWNIVLRIVWLLYGFVRNFIVTVPISTWVIVELTNGHEGMLVLPLLRKRRFRDWSRSSHFRWRHVRMRTLRPATG